MQTPSPLSILPPPILRVTHTDRYNRYTKRFEVRCKIFINPLSSLKEKFCKGGVIFSCLYDKRIRDVFAAGGRYDSLIREHRHQSGGPGECHAVGFNLAWEKLARLPKVSGKGFLKKAEEELQGIWNTKRVSKTQFPARHYGIANHGC